MRPTGAQSSVAAVADPGVDYGEVFTKPWVVDFILDLVGYTPGIDLGAKRLVEPSCGTGAFLLPVVDRLLASAEQHGRPISSLGSAIVAFDLLEANVKLARKHVSERLRAAGASLRVATSMAARWITTGDFLLASHDDVQADFCVGNPPYIRLESVPVDRMRRYRERCQTMVGRADIYVGFFEVGLELLSADGVLGFICADRWMRNQYGAELRSMFGSEFAMEALVNLHDVDVFDDDVSAYPAVTIVRRRAGRQSIVVDTTSGFDAAAACRVSTWASSGRTKQRSGTSFDATKVNGVFAGRDLWPAGTSEQLAVIADLERRFSPLQDEATGTRVGIGVATGCDAVFLTDDPDLVETDRLMPLLRSADIASGTAEWSGTYVVNPWTSDGLVDLDDYSRLGTYLRAHEDRLRARHVGRRQPDRWFRTIDRIHPQKLDRPRLLLPDMKASAHPVLDDGTGYPDHNLYTVESTGWDLSVLGGLLLSDVTNLFIGAYCVKMRGGCYRFQAQYLRRIRVPDPAAISPADRRALRSAFRRRDVAAATTVSLRLYGIDRLPEG